MENTLRRYTVGEEIFNSISHGIGAALGVAGTIVLIVLSAINGSNVAMVSSLIYGISLIILYSMSTLYHAITNVKAKEVMRVFDHTSIFLLIAGSYTPFCLIALNGNTRAMVVISAVWICAIIGIIFNSINLEKAEKPSMVLYVAMGWAILAVFKDIIHVLPTPAFWLLFLGGVSYTGGLIFFGSKKRYMHSIWHLFVLLGSVLHFICVAVYVMPMA